jgi:hypothetical protein
VYVAHLWKSPSLWPGKFLSFQFSTTFGPALLTFYDQHIFPYMWVYSCSWRYLLQFTFLHRPISCSWQKVRGPSSKMKFFGDQLINYCLALLKMHWFKCCKWWISYIYHDETEYTSVLWKFLLNLLWNFSKLKTFCCFQMVFGPVAPSQALLLNGNLITF